MSQSNTWIDRVLGLRNGGGYPNGLDGTDHTVPLKWDFTKWSSTGQKAKTQSCQIFFDEWHIIQKVIKLAYVKMRGRARSRLYNEESSEGDVWKPSMWTNVDSQNI